LNESVESENNNGRVRGGVLDLVFELFVCYSEAHVSSTMWN
jgi:hypothetical protein